MTKLAEIKQLIEDDAKNTEALRSEVKKLKGDIVDQDSFKELEGLVAKASEKRQDFETQYKKDIEEAKTLAEEASLKAGRRGGDSGDEADAVLVEHKSAFENFMRNPSDNDAQSELKAAEAKYFEEKSINASTGTSGNAVPLLIARNIQSKTNDDSVMAGLVNVVTGVTSEYRELIDKGGMGFGWVGEGDARNGTGTPDIYPAEPSVGTVYAYPEATEESLDNVFFDVPAWLIGSARTAFANARDVGVISGNGVKKPMGMLGRLPLIDADGTRADGRYQYIKTGVADGLGEAKNLINFIYKLKSQYRSNGSFLMNSLTTAGVRTMTDDNGRFLWGDSLVVGQPSTLLGYSVNAVESMPDVAANAHPIGFGDFKKAYTLVEGHELRVTRDDLTKPGFVKWHIRQKLGGMPTNDDAVKFLRCAA